MTASDALDRVKDLTGGRGADVVYDVTGHPGVPPRRVAGGRRPDRRVVRVLVHIEDNGLVPGEPSVATTA